ncbi:hypothetical protein [Acinetobacter sp. ANC 3929]|uniref:hypothetical protein n=1 Tax=Acinetobacter sp. ANC 3929 TaxID=1217707 RepID=UPI001D179989|nr:hypothetical protein [Acinetobacter sp. ANC 3929]
MTRAVIEVTPEMEFSSTIVNGHGEVIANCEIEICDQVTAKGGVLIKVDQTITSTWKAGTATGDVLLKIGDQKRNSGNYSFTIDKSITK